MYGRQDLITIFYDTTKRKAYLEEWKSEIIYTENKMIFLNIVKSYYILELKINILNQYDYIFIACLFASIDSIFKVLILLIKKKYRLTPIIGLHYKINNISKLKKRTLLEYAVKLSTFYGKFLKLMNFWINLMIHFKFKEY